MIGLLASCVVPEDAGRSAWFTVAETGMLTNPEVPSKRYPVALDMVGLGTAPTVGIGEPTGFKGMDVRVPLAVEPSEPLFVTVVLDAFVSCMRSHKSGESAVTAVP